MIKRLAIIVVAVWAVFTSAPFTVMAPKTVAVTSFTIPASIPPKPTPTPTPESLFYEVTAYTAGTESTGKRRDSPQYGITAAGTTVMDGYTLACPATMPFGTVVIIDTVGARTCADRGGTITDGRLDVYVSDLSVARKFGRRRLPVIILKSGSGYVE